ARRRLTTELRQPARGGLGTCDFALYLRQLLATRVDAFLRGLRVVVPERERAAKGQHHEDADLAVPRQLVETEVHAPPFGAAAAPRAARAGGGGGGVVC